MREIIGWKSIAKRYKVSERAIKYWHKAIPLPVYRLTKNGPVRATIAGLNEYLEKRRRIVTRTY